MNFGYKLKNLMEENNITQLELAQKIGYTQRAVSKWVNNQSEPTETAIKKCANFFQVSTDYLLGLSDEYEISAATQKHEDYPLNENDMRFSQIIKELREEKGLSQKELSKVIGISSSGIGHLELGEREPSSTSLLAYSRYFGVSTDYLLGISDDYSISNTVKTNSVASDESYSPKNKMNYGEALKYIREEKNLSQSALSRATGISQQMLSWWESGKGLPNIDFCVTLAKYYGITLEELLGISDEMKTVALSSPAGIDAATTDMNKTSPIGESYSSEEKEIIHKYRNLSPDVQEVVRKILNN